MDKVTSAVETWLTNVVIGLNLCPFAKQPVTQKRVKIQLSTAQDEFDVLAELKLEMDILHQTAPKELETTLLVCPNTFQDFGDYNNFLDQADRLIKRLGWRGTFQIASFHPDYCFADSHPEDADNLTNRSPYPIFHILREESLEKALDFFPNPEAIPENNICTVRNLSAEQKRQLFPYLFAAV